MSLQLGEVPTIVVSSPEMAIEVMKTHDIIFASRSHIIATRIMSYDSTNIAFSPYGPYWRQLRKISATELLSPKRVLSFQTIRQEEVSKLIKSIALNAGSPVNLTQKLYSSAYEITSRIAFGKKFNDHEVFISIVKEAIKVASGFNVADFYPSSEWLHNISGVKSKLEKNHKEADRIMEIMINEHRTRKTTNKGREDDDLVDALLEYHERGPNEFSLTVNNIKAVILDILVGGSDTTATTVEWAMSEIIKNPKIMKKAQDEVRRVFDGKGNVDETGLEELKYLKLIIKETLRFHPPVPLLPPRVCRETCEINGYEIPEKAKIIVNAWAIGRDPNHWDDAESFIPERFLDSTIDFKGNNFEYIPFGAGRRICPGMNYGLVIVEFELAQLLFYFDWKLPGGMKPEDLDMTEEFGSTVGRKEDLTVIPIPYKSCTL
jgi:cytochrome P450